MKVVSLILFYLKFVYRNFAIVCIVYLIKLLYYQVSYSSLFLLSLLATSNVVAGKKALQWTFMLLGELIIQMDILKIQLIVILLRTIGQRDVEEQDLAMAIGLLERFLKDATKKMTKRETLI